MKRGADQKRKRRRERSLEAGLLSPQKSLAKALCDVETLSLHDSSLQNYRFILSTYIFDSKFETIKTLICLTHKTCT